MSTEWVICRQSFCCHFNPPWIRQWDLLASEICFKLPWQKWLLGESNGKRVCAGELEGLSAHGSLPDMNDSLLAQFKKKIKRSWASEFRSGGSRPSNPVTFPFMESRCVLSFYRVANDFSCICTIVFVLTVLNCVAMNYRVCLKKKLALTYFRVPWGSSCNSS